MSVLSRIASVLIVPLAKLIGRALGRVLQSKQPSIAYDREPVTRRWIAQLNGYRAVGDTRADAARNVLLLDAKRKGPQ